MRNVIPHRKWLPAVLSGGLILTVMLGMSACKPAGKVKGESADRGPGPPVRRVKTCPVESRTVERVVRVLGTLVAWEQATLSTKVPGRLQSLTVDVGSLVKTGEVLARIESRDYELRVRQAEAALAQARARLGLPLEGADDQLEPGQVSSVKQARAVLDEARANHERVCKLAESGILSKSEVDTAEAAFVVAQNRYQVALEDARDRQAMVRQRRAEVDIARQQLADTVIQAPFDGTVQERKANLGEYLSAAASVATLVQLDPVRLRLEISDRDAARIRGGQMVRVTIEGDTHCYSGAIARISPAFAEQSHMLIVEADLPNPGTLHPGTFARAEIVVQDQARALAVPPAALSVFAGVEKAFIIQNGKAVERRITTGDRAPDWIEVVEGLQAGEAVILQPGNLQSGHPVSAAP